MKSTTKRSPKRILAIVLAMVMVLSLLPVTAIAAGDTLESGRFNITSGADAVSAVPAEMARGDANQAGRVWTARSVVDNEDGTFTVTLLALGLEYDGNLPLAPGSSLVIKDKFNSNDFSISGASGLAVDGANVTWTIPAAALSADAGEPNSISYTLTLTTLEEGKYFTHPEAAAATFKVTDDNWYYWTKETDEKELIISFSGANWSNGNAFSNYPTSLKGSIISFTLVDPETKRSTALGKPYNEDNGKLDFDGSAFDARLKTSPTSTFYMLKSVHYNPLKASEKVYSVKIAVYVSPGVYDIYEGDIIVPSLTGGNTGTGTFTKKTISIDKWLPVHGNDGNGNVTHSDLANLGWIELELAFYPVVVNHYYKTITTKEDGTINDPAYEIGFTENYSKNMGDPFAAELRPEGPGGMYTFDSKISSGLTLNVSTDASKNIIDLYYERELDLRAEATVKVLHVYTTNYWTLENGKFTEATATHTVPGYDSEKANAVWKATESFTAAKRNRGFGFTGAATTAPGGLTDNGPDVTITLGGGENVITFNYVKNIDNREAVDFTVTHNYARTEVRIENGKPVTYVTDGTYTENYTGWYKGETFEGAQINFFDGENYVSDGGNAAKIAPRALIGDGSDNIELYYTLYIAPGTTTVTVIHNYREWLQIDADEETGDPIYADEPNVRTFTVELPAGTEVMYEGQSFMASLRGRQGYSFNRGDSDARMTTLLPGGNVINLYYDKMTDDRDDAGIDVTYNYYTNLETIIDGKVETIRVHDGYDNDSYEGLVGEVFTPENRDMFDGNEYDLVSDESLLDPVWLRSGDNGTIELVYERDDSDLVAGGLTVNYVYKTYEMTVENGKADYHDAPIVDDTAEPWSPEGPVYIRQVIDNIPDGARDGFGPEGVNPATTHTITGEDDALTFTYERYIPLPTAGIEVNHNYKTYEMKIVNGAPAYVLVDEEDVGPVTYEMYVGELFTADRLDDGFEYLGAVSDNESFDEDALTMTVAADGNVISMSYEIRTNPLAEATYAINHIYVTIDFDGTETIEDGLNNSVSNSGYEGMIVTATLNTISGAFEIAEGRSSATNGFAEEYGFPTIELAEGGDNVINLVYTRDVDTRVRTSVTVNHIYSTEYRIDDIFSKLEEDGVFSETFSTFEDGIWAGKEFTANLIEMYGDEEYLFDSKDASPDFIAEDGEGLCLTISLDSESNVININYIRVINNNTPVVQTRNYRVTVNFIDKDTGEAVMAAKVGAAQPAGSEYKESIPAIDGYTFDSITGDELEGRLNSNKVINLYYVKDAEIIIVPDEPLAAIEEDPQLMIDEDDIPLAVYESPAEEEEAEEFGIIEEDDVPLAELPQTGVSPFALPLIVFGLAVVGLGIIMKGVRKEEEDSAE